MVAAFPPTHDLPHAFELRLDPGSPGASGGQADAARYELVERYPTSGRSRLLSLAALSLPWRNPGFLVVPGLVSVAMLWTIQFGLRSLGRNGRSFAERPPTGAGPTWPAASSATRCRP